MYIIHQTEKEEPDASAEIAAQFNVIHSITWRTLHEQLLSI